LLVSNGAPVLVCKWLGSRRQRPVDGDLRLPDGAPVFGTSKTWCGLVAALTLTGLTAILLGVPLVTGLQIAALAMAGDLASSFVKRRMGVPASGTVPVLDQVPESLLPLLAVREQFGLGWPMVFALTFAFLALDLLLSRVFGRRAGDGFP
jgi:CDP-2,3-bis-(O-geranylgeranyl)-sn-glycerol synthase